VKQVQGFGGDEGVGGEGEGFAGIGVGVGSGHGFCVYFVT